MNLFPVNRTFEYAGWAVRYGIYGDLTADDRQDSQVRTVVFVHGTPWSSIVFQELAQTLLSKGNIRVLLYDLPGYGQSQYLDPACTTSSHAGLFRGDTSVKAQACALSALLEHLHLTGKNGETRPAVIAHDIAGTIVLRTHLIHGCEFDSLMLLDTNAVLPWGDGFYKLVRSEPEVFLKLPPDIFEAVVRAVVRSAVHDPKVLEERWEDALVRPWVSGAEAQKSFVRQIAQANDADVAEMVDKDMYRRVTCDVKIVWGERDEWIPREKMEQLEKLLGDRLKEFVVVPDAGHLVILDQPRRVECEVLQWLFDKCSDE